MLAPDGEKVKFQPKSIVLEGPVEQWLGKVSATEVCSSDWRCR